MGNPGFAVPALRTLAQSMHSVECVVTGTDKKRGRGGKKSPSEVKSEANMLGLPVYECDDPSEQELQKLLKTIRPDLLVVVAYKMLPSSVLAIPKIGSVNLHASLLPKYRGAAPIHHAIMNGEKETGCTVFLLDEGMDTGKIIATSSSEIGWMETTGDVYHRLMHVGAELLLEAVQALASGTYTLKEQGDGGDTRAPRLRPEDARIRFDQDGIRVHNHIRAMNPFPGAWTMFMDKKIKLILSAPAMDIQTLAPGTGRVINGKAMVGCNPGSVEILKVRPEGKKEMDGVSFINGCEGEVVFS
ncbi:methionyl-tRNA formyltransferase [Balneolaceae bacterium ANBcel3]|nr:methionyl-tRNA formyltransferase [Balneolaceae bacterium ANBcel3]